MTQYSQRAREAVERLNANRVEPCPGRGSSYVPFNPAAGESQCWHCGLPHDRHVVTAPERDCPHGGCPLRGTNYLPGTGDAKLAALHEQAQMLLEALALVVPFSDDDDTVRAFPGDWATIRWRMHALQEALYVA